MMKLFISLFAALVCLAAAPARAGVIYTFAYSGEVTTLDVDMGLFGPVGTVSVGDAFSGTFSYIVGPENTDKLADPEFGQYDLLSATLDGTALPLGPVDAFGVIIEHSAPVPVILPAPPDEGEDSLTIPLGITLGLYNVISLQLQAPFDMAFSDDSLPTSLDLSDFAIAQIAGRGPSSIIPDVPSLNDIGTITSLTLISAIPTTPQEVPLPASAFLFLAGAGALARFRRIRRRPA